jgi:hypothetical protein
MPISKEELKKSDFIEILKWEYILCHMDTEILKEIIVDFLKRNDDLFFTADEIADGIGFDADMLNTLLDLSGIRRFFGKVHKPCLQRFFPFVVEDLVKEGRIKKKFIAFEYYYTINGEST